MSYTNGLDKPSDYFNTKLYTGTGSELALTGINFQPDLTWIKNRDTTDSHQLVDSVRGATKNLFSNLTNAEATDAQGLKSFDTDGFTVGTRLGMNTSGESYVGWSWLGGGTASSNTDGSITSTVSANQISGFSIVTYSGNSTAGATVGHGLVGVVPSVVLVKSRDGAYGWGMYHHKNTSAPETDYLSINSTDATVDDVNFWNDTAPTSSVFSLGGTDAINKTSNSHVAYVFAEKKGYSKFGSYTGNGSATDGTFVYTGFKPAFVMIKCSSESGSYTSWSMFDTTRQTFNVNAGKTLYANKSSAEGVRGNGSDSSTTIPAIDMLSNGFKCRVLNDEVNNTATYIYMAFAESPFVTSTGIPTTAR